MSRPALPTPPRAVGTTRLADGREMGWAQYGDLDGDAVLWFHGTPGARAQIPHDLDAEAQARRLRIISIERPGTGDSTDHQYDQIVDFVPDALAVVDDLGIEQFAAVGMSGGGPFVLACAHELPGRMTTGVVLGGVGPTCGTDTVISYMLILRVTGGLLERIRRPAGKLAGKVFRLLGPYGGPVIDLFFQFEVGDRSEMHAKRDTKSQLVADLVDAAYRSDLQAMFEDLILFGRHWGFELGDITVPITFWGGTSDLIVPYTQAERQWKRVPGSNLRTMEGRGHFAGYTEVSQVLDVIRSKWPAVRPVRATASGARKASKKSPKKASKTSSIGGD